MMLDAHSKQWHISLALHHNAQWLPSFYQHIGRNEKCDDCDARINIFVIVIEMLKFRFRIMYDDRTHKDRVAAEQFAKEHGLD